MGLQSMDLSPIIADATPNVLAAPAPEASRQRLVCRCDGCGSVVTFDALIVSCRCAEDSRPADSVLH